MSLFDASIARPSKVSLIGWSLGGVYAREIARLQPENIRAHNPMALFVIGDRLAQPEGRWARFERNGLKKLLYPTPALGRDLEGLT